MIRLRTVLTLLLSGILAGNLGADPKNPKPDCVGGCATVQRTQPVLENSSVRSLLDRYRNACDTARDDLLDQLVFHWESVSLFLAESAGNEISQPEIRFLRQEVERDRVRVRIAVRDEEGRHLVHLDRVVPIGIKQHLHAENPDGTTRPIASFTAERVALDRIWFRL